MESDNNKKKKVSDVAVLTLVKVGLRVKNIARIKNIIL